MIIIFVTGIGTYIGKSIIFNGSLISFLLAVVES